MTTELRDVMTRMADRVEPAPPDQTLWSRAQRSRRRIDVASATMAGAAVLALVAITGVAARPDADRPEPAPAGREGIPSIVWGPDGTGGLPLETDLAVGDASVAMANPRGAFVVTAEDGVPHRLHLPGFDPKVYDDDRVRRTGMVGLSLSPDGTRLAYGWHAPLPAETGQEHGFVRSGLRILDLASGRVRDVPEDRVPPGEFGAAIDNQGFPWGRVPYGLRWSPDGRYLGYDLVWAALATDDLAVEHWGDDLSDAYHQALFATGGSVYDTATDTRHDVRQTRLDDTEFWLSSMWSTGWPKAVGDDGTLWTVGLNNTVTSATPGGRVADGRPLPGGAVGESPYTAGLVDGSRRILLETRRPSSELLAVDLRTGATERLELPLTPVNVDLLGWIGRDHVMAQVRQGTEQNLVVLDLSAGKVESNLVAPFDDEGTDSTFSFATGLATVQHPTGRFAAADRSGQAGDDTDPALPGAREAVPDVTWWLGGIAGAIVVAVGTIMARRRRIRV